MRYTTLGRSGTVVSTQTLGTMTFGAEADEPASQDPGGVRRAWRHLHRHRGRLQPRRLGGDHRPLAGRPPRPTRSSWSSRPRAGSRWARAQRRRALAAPPAGGARRVAAAPRRRAHRPLPDARLGRRHPARGDAAFPRRRRDRRQDLATTASPTTSAGRSPRPSTLAARHGWSAPVTLQPQYNLLVRGIEHEVVPACLDAGMGLLPWSPLAGGWLSGKYQRDEAPTGDSRLGENPERGMEAWGPRNAQPRTWDVMDAVARGGQELGVSLRAGVAGLARRPAGGHLGHPRRPDGRAAGDNLGAADLDLAPEHLDRLDEVSAPQMEDYPYGPAGTAQRHREVPRHGWCRGTSAVTPSRDAVSRRGARRRGWRPGR